MALVASRPEAPHRNKEGDSWPLGSPLVRGAGPQLLTLRIVSSIGRRVCPGGWARGGFVLFSTAAASRGVPAEFGAMHVNLSTVETTPFHWFAGAGRMEGVAHNCSPILEDSLSDGPVGVKANRSGGDPRPRALSLITGAIRLAISLD